MASSARADVTLPPFYMVNDTYIDSRDPTENYYWATVDKVVWNDKDGSRCRALIELPKELWDLPKSSLLSVKIMMYSWDPTRTLGQTVSLFPLTQSFVPGGTTWNTYDADLSHTWATPGGDYDPARYVVGTSDYPSSNWFAFDITSLWDNPNLRTNGLLLRMTDESTYFSGGMPRAPFTSSSGATSDVPYVLVTQVPEPVSLVLLAGGGLLLHRQRKDSPATIVR